MGAGSTAAGHDRKDAEDRARTEIAVELRRYTRRLKELAIAELQTASFENKTPEEVGRAASQYALSCLGFHEQPREALSSGDA